MSLGSRVWDGPFKAPPVQYPITIGWVLLKFLETIWRFILLLVVIIALFLGFIWYSQESPLGSQVKVNLSRSTQYCSAKGWPIEARITNASRKTIGEIGLKFRVYPYGKSQDIAAYAAGSDQELHNIIRPGESLDWCFPMPQINQGATGPFSIVGDVTYATELSKDVPIADIPPPKL